MGRFQLSWDELSTIREDGENNISHISSIGGSVLAVDCVAPRDELPHHKSFDDRDDEESAGSTSNYLWRLFKVTPHAMAFGDNPSITPSTTQDDDENDAYQHTIAAQTPRRKRRKNRTQGRLSCAATLFKRSPLWIQTAVVISTAIAFASIIVIVVSVVVLRNKNRDTAINQPSIGVDQDSLAQLPLRSPTSAPHSPMAPPATTNRKNTPTLAPTFPPVESLVDPLIVVKIPLAQPSFAPSQAPYGHKEPVIGDQTDLSEPEKNASNSDALP